MITTKSLKTTVVHFPKTCCLESGLFLKIVTSATILEQHIKVPRY
jgi:hypothetical protein